MAEKERARGAQRREEKGVPWQKTRGGAEGGPRAVQWIVYESEWNREVRAVEGEYEMVGGSGEGAMTGMKYL